MASCFPFDDDDVPVEERFRQMSDEELLTFWEHSQRLFFAFLLKNGIPVPAGGFPTEEKIVAELTRRSILGGGDAGTPRDFSPASIPADASRVSRKSS